MPPQNWALNEFSLKKKYFTIYGENCIVGTNKKKYLSMFGFL